MTLIVHLINIVLEDQGKLEHNRRRADAPPADEEGLIDMIVLWHWNRDQHIVPWPHYHGPWAKYMTGHDWVPKLVKISYLNSYV